VATGTFGTIPGLMLLPYLTDSLGIAALAAGFIVFAPKAWDVVLNPIAGRISDRTVDARGPRRPWLRRAGIALAVTFALLFAAPSMATGLEALWVLILFLTCATAYAFFQVPYVAMPAELTESYDERTRLMTWRVAILALTILLAGATAPMIRDAVGGRDGYRVMDVVMTVLILAGVFSAYAGTRRAPVHIVRLGAVLRARSRGPGHRDRGSRGRARDPLPRRPVHRWLGAALRDAAGAGRTGLDVRGRRRRLDLRRPAQVRLRPQGHLGAAAPHP
jgi:Na+/melibiose symporter-like transporter